MTTIIAYEHEGGVTLGWDSQVSLGSHIYHGAHQKVFANGSIVLGVAGALSDAKILQYAELADPDESGWDIDRWVTNELVPSIFHALAERNRATVTNSQIETESTILAVVKGRVYEISSDQAADRRVDNIYTIGSGSHFARGALAAGASVRTALGIAADHDYGTGFKLYVAQDTELIQEGLS